MMEPTVSLSEDTALAEALTKLKALEKENSRLRSNCSSRSSGENCSAESSQELRRLKHHVEELMQVNHQWDLEYREQSSNFRTYKIDSQQEQAEKQSLIVTLKDKTEKITERMRTLETDYKHCYRERNELKTRMATMEAKLRRADVAGPQAVVSHKKIRELEEECQLLGQQLKTYQDDFLDERKDRERIYEEKQCSDIKHEAEVTSMRLQLERCRGELAHYTAEANRLSQQLRMKNHCDEEQYKKHLESRGYITRSPSGHLPPLDPFVEPDDEKCPHRSTSIPCPRSPRLLTRGVDLIHAYSKTQGAQVHSGSNGVPPSGLDSDPSQCPIKPNAERNGMRFSSSGYNCTLRQPPHSSPPHTPSSSSCKYNATAGSNNGYAMSQGNTNTDIYQYSGGLSNGVATNGHQNGMGVANGVTANNGNYGMDIPSPIETNYCPRCAQEFRSRVDCDDHKTRCLTANYWQDK